MVVVEGGGATVVVVEVLERVEVVVDVVVADVEEVEVVVVDATLNVSVPVAPLESVALMTYVPGFQAEPTVVAYENVPLDWTGTAPVSREAVEPCSFT